MDARVATLQQGTGQPAQSVPAIRGARWGKVHLLAAASFVMFILAVLVIAGNWRTISQFSVSATVEKAVLACDYSISQPAGETGAAMAPRRLACSDEAGARRLREQGYDRVSRLWQARVVYRHHAHEEVRRVISIAADEVPVLEAGTRLDLAAPLFAPGRLVLADASAGPAAQRATMLAALLAAAAALTGFGAVLLLR